MTFTTSNCGPFSRALPIERVSVVGVGLMGQSIAALHLARGMTVTISDATEAAAAAGIEPILHRTKHFASGELAGFSSDVLRGRLHIARTDAEIADADIVIEAIVENARIKNRVLSRIAAHLPADSIIATNTSSLSVDVIAAALPRPEQVCGWHFCHPVAERQLVEVVRGKCTSDETITRVVTLAERLGKLPLVVPDTPGFVVNRLLSPYLNEGLELLRDGVDPIDMERSAVEFGLPWGPLRQLDAIGIDICLRVGASLRKAYPAHVAESGLLVPLFEAGRFGNKCGAGILCDPELDETDATGMMPITEESSDRNCLPRPAVGGRKGITSLPPAVQQIVERFRRDVPPVSQQDIRDRLLLPMVCEAVRILDEGLVADSADIDTAIVHGLSFFAEQGGVLRWAESIGFGTIVARLKELRRFGERFTPPARMIAAARTTERLCA